MDANNPNRFQILSLDGGGIKGLFSAAVLAKIEEDLSVLAQRDLDRIRRELPAHCHSIQPNDFPILSVEHIEERH
jgi:hypothetical protein